MHAVRPNWDEATYVMGHIVQLHRLCHAHSPPVVQSPPVVGCTAHPGKAPLPEDSAWAHAWAIPEPEELQLSVLKPRWNDPAAPSQKGLASGERRGEAMLAPAHFVCGCVAPAEVARAATLLFCAQFPPWHGSGSPEITMPGDTSGGINACSIRPKQAGDYTAPSGGTWCVLCRVPW